MSTIQDSLTGQQFSMIMSRAAYYKVYTNRLQLRCLPQCQNRSVLSPQLSTVPIQLLPQCNRLLVLCEFESFAVTSDAMNFYEFLKFRKIREFLRISNTEVTNSQSICVVCARYNGRSQNRLIPVGL